MRSLWARHYFCICCFYVVSFSYQVISSVIVEITPNYVTQLQVECFTGLKMIKMINCLNVHFVGSSLFCISCFYVVSSNFDSYYSRNYTELCNAVTRGMLHSVLTVV